MIESNDGFICKYPEKDLVQILKDTGYHSDEWEKTDPEQEWPIIQEEVVEDDITVKEAVKKKQHHYMYMKNGGVLPQYVCQICSSSIADIIRDHGSLMISAIEW